MQRQAILRTPLRQSCPNAARVPFGRTHDQGIVGKPIQGHPALTLGLHHLLNPQVEHMM
jgi:hypothetical protein